YAARGTIKYADNGPPTVEYEDHFLKSGRALSSCVPVYVNEVPEIDQSFIQPGEVSEISLTRPLTDEAIANNSTVANWIMTFSEFYLAYRLAREENGPRILLLDRSLATMLASLIYDTSRRKLWTTNGALFGLDVEGIPEETVGTFSLKDRYRKTWPRIRSLVETLGHRMFEEQPKQNPLRVMKKGDLHWLTTQDLAFLTLFTLNLLVEECWKKRILL